MITCTVPRARVHRPPAAVPNKRSDYRTNITCREVSVIVIVISSGYLATNNGGSGSAVWSSDTTSAGQTQEEGGGARGACGGRAQGGANGAAELLPAICHAPGSLGTRVLISLWNSLMFGRVPGTRPNTSESHSEISTRVPYFIEGRKAWQGAWFMNGKGPA